MMFVNSSHHRPTPGLLNKPASRTVPKALFETPKKAGVAPATPRRLALTNTAPPFSILIIRRNCLHGLKRIVVFYDFSLLSSKLVNWRALFESKCQYTQYLIDSPHKWHGFIFFFFFNVLFTLYECVS